MKLLCECGHANHLHFAGTGNCHSPVWESTGPNLSEMHAPQGFFTRCECQRFVPELVREPKDTA